MKRTKEEKDAWRSKMRALAKQIKQISPERQAELAGRIGTITAEGHRLSTFNTIFLAMQSGNGGFVQVGGYRQWQRVGRKVRKGESSIGSIFVPLGKKKDENGDIDDEEKTRFLTVPMFDVNQTEETV